MSDIEAQNEEITRLAKELQDSRLLIVSEEALADLRKELEEARAEIEGWKREYLREREALLSKFNSAYKRAEEAEKRVAELEAIGEWLTDLIYEGRGAISLSTTEDGDIGVFLGDEEFTMSRSDDAFGALERAYDISCYAASQFPVKCAKCGQTIVEERDETLNAYWRHPDVVADHEATPGAITGPRHPAALTTPTTTETKGE